MPTVTKRPFTVRFGGQRITHLTGLKFRELIGFRRDYWFPVLPETTRSNECGLSFKRKEAASPRNRFGLRSIGQLRQVHVERDDGDGNLPAFEHFGVDFADHADGFAGHDDMPSSTF